MHDSLRNRLTPNEEIRRLIMPFDFMDNQYQQLPPQENISLKLIEDMPPKSYFDVAINPDTLRMFRLRAYSGELGKELAFDVVGSVGDGFLARVYCIAPGCYYAPARARFDEILNDMQEGLLHYITFSNIDTLHLFWNYSKKWMERNAKAVRVNCTYEGMVNTLQVRRIPEAKMTDKEFEAVRKAQGKIERMQAATSSGQVVEGSKPRNYSEPTKPYHSMAVGDTVIVAASEFSNFKSFRVIVYSYGGRNKKKFSVKMAQDGSAIIYRSE